jgi:hypothetical protein
MGSARHEEGAGGTEVMSVGTSQKRESVFCSRVARIMLDERPVNMVGNRLPLEKSSAMQPTLSNRGSRAPLPKTLALHSF